MNAEQWLADLEKRAQAVLSLNDNASHAERAACSILLACSANPETVLRLVEMVRALAVRAGYSGCPQGWKCEDGSYDCHICHTQHAYQQTEPEPCQK